MNSFDKKIQTRLRMHPEMLRNLLVIPNQDAIDTLNRYQIFESRNAYLGQLLLSLLPQWEYLACEGNADLGKVIRILDSKRISPIQEEAEFLRTHLLRIRVLAETPGIFPFSPFYIQENLTRFLEASELLADLPQCEVVSFSNEELLPLAHDLSQYRISPLSRRYVQNLFHPERREAILSVLAHITKNYPLLGTCRQAYALMLSLDEPEIWSSHPFCVRLIANRFWEYRVREHI
jgi:hypothetical protein